MKQIFHFIPIFLFAINCFSQYATGHTTITFYDASRSRNIPVEIYYPGNIAGDDVSVAGTTEKFSYVIMSHGFTMSYSLYSNIWEALVPEGYIVVLPKTEGSLFPSHTNYAKDIAFLSTEFRKQGKLITSLFYQRIKNKCAAMGHSMGGGATLLALQYANRINTTITFAAAETSPSAISYCSSIVKPSLLFAGEDDCVTPFEVHQQPMYDNLASACKTLININGANHCQFADYDFACSLGELFCSTGITREEQHDVMNTFMLPWLDYFLNGDVSALSTFNTELTTSSAMTYSQSCSLKDAVVASEEKDLLVFPNPASNELHLISDENFTHVQVFDMKGNLIQNMQVVENRINVSAIPAGTYLLRLSSENFTYSKVITIVN